MFGKLFSNAATLFSFSLKAINSPYSTIISWAESRLYKLPNFKFISKKLLCSLTKRMHLETNKLKLVFYLKKWLIDDPAVVEVCVRFFISFAIVWRKWRQIPYVKLKTLLCWRVYIFEYSHWKYSLNYFLKNISYSFIASSIFFFGTDD